MTSIFEGLTPHSKAFSNQNKGPHLGSRHVYLVTSVAKLLQLHHYVCVELFGCIFWPHYFFAFMDEGKLIRVIHIFKHLQMMSELKANS